MAFRSNTIYSNGEKVIYFFRKIDNRPASQSVNIVNLKSNVLGFLLLSLLTLSG
jgi:hypothetical protein